MAGHLCLLPKQTRQWASFAKALHYKYTEKDIYALHPITSREVHAFFVRVLSDNLGLFPRPQRPILPLNP